MEKGKVKTVAATINSDVCSEFAKYLKQQQQLGSLMGQMKSLCTDLKAAQTTPLRESSQ